MRTLKTLVAFGALLLVASGANAAVQFTLSLASDADPAQEVDLTLTLTGGTGADIPVFQIDWLLNGATIPLAAVELPAGGAPPQGAPGEGPAIVPSPCNTGTTNQFMCAFGGGNAIGSQGSNDVGTAWLWSFASPAVADGSYSLGRFTFTALASGDVSIGNCFIIASIPDEFVPCSSNTVAIPEPTTTALLGLGLLALAGWRRVSA
jgi:hypothetical protein